MAEKEEIEKAMVASGEKWGLHPDEGERNQYAELVSMWVEDMEAALSVQGDHPPTDVSGDRSSYRPDPSDNKYNAWNVKCTIQEQTSGKLAGKKVAIKDNVNVGGLPITNGSGLLSDNVADYDASVVKRILQEGGVIAGTATCENLCFSGSSFTSATGPVLNPHDVTRSTGGSSSGSAALVAAGEVDMAIGGDQGGSIRIPSSWCGIVGLKPTHGLVPYTGAMAMHPNFDHLGPMASKVTDCALLLEVIAGSDGYDIRQAVNTEVPAYSKNLSSDVSKLRVALLEEGFSKCEPEVVDVVRAAVDLLRPHVAAVEEISIPIITDYSSFYLAELVAGRHEFTFKNFGTSASFGGFQDLKLYDHLAKHLKERAHDLSPTAKLALYTAEYMEKKHGSRLYAHSVNCKNKMRKEVDAILEKYDVIIMPTLPCVATKLPSPDVSLKDYIELAFCMIANTPMFNATQHPALTINAGTVRGLPVGMMITGKHWHEQTVLNMAYAWEQIRDKQ